MNIVALIGNVAADPEMRETAQGRAVCNFRLAVSRPSGEQADFLTIVAWERQAQVCRDYLTIGRRVGIEGRLHYSTWEVEGVKRSRVEVIANRVELLGGPRVQRTQNSEEATAPAEPRTAEIMVTPSNPEVDEKEPAFA